MAFFSGTDNNDDIKGRYSCVVGKNAKVVPDVKCRFNYAGKYVDMTIEDIFEDNDNYIHQEYDMAEWIKKLNYSKETVICQTNVKIAPNVNLISPNMMEDYYSVDPYAPYYSGYFKNRRSGKEGHFQNKNETFMPAVEKCTQCGKFTKVTELYQIEAELLCTRCLTELGLGVE